MDDVEALLITCVGHNYGPHPLERIDDIRADREALGQTICTRAGVGSDDFVVDLGSGCGFVTRAACKIAQRVACLDISKEFLDYARDELSEFSNAEFHQIEYGDFRPLGDGVVSCLYASAVFIHFVYYDYLFYLAEANRVLLDGGRFYVEILDADDLDLEDARAIRDHILSYRQHHEQYRMLQPFSRTAFLHLAPQYGLAVREEWKAGNTKSFLLEKMGPPKLPDWFRTSPPAAPQATT